MTRAQFAATLRWEDRSRNRRTEDFAAITDDGRVNPLGNPVIRRRRDQVVMNSALVPRNAVLTHNHPWSEGMGTGLGSRVGVSLSGADLRVAVNTNAKEIRAVTSNYIYSLKRPASGWNASGTQLKSEMDELYARNLRDMQTTIRRLQQTRGLTRQELEVRMGRINALASHQAIREVARRHGIRYTRRRSS